MPIGIVEVLEMIDIQHEDREWDLAAFGALELAFERNLHEVPVKQACKRIPDRLVLQPAPQVKPCYRNRREFRELVERGQPLLDQSGDLFRWTLDGEHPKGIALRRERKAEISFGHRLQEMSTVNLRVARQTPAEVTRAKPAAGVERKGVR